METALNAIQALLGYCVTHGIDLVARFRHQRFFTVPELDGIRDMCQKRLSVERSPRVISIDKTRPASGRRTGNVANATEYVRLTYIAQYSRWLAQTLLAHSIDDDTAQRLNQVVTQLKARRPPKKGRNRLGRTKGLDDRQVETLTELIRPGSPMNPFKDAGVQYRNFVIILLLRYLGIRAGELLNLKTTDIKTGDNRLVIARRADEKGDPRIDQPLVKTLDRLDPMRETLALAIHTYIKQHRRNVPNARSHFYLFVTHKAGNTVGQPLSVAGFQKMIKRIATSAVELGEFHAHAMRHRWNEEFSRYMDGLENPPSLVEQEQMRNYLMGWKPGSGTATAYNERHIQRKAMEAAQKLQEGMMRIPERLKDETRGTRTR